MHGLADAALPGGALAGVPWDHTNPPHPHQPLLNTFKLRLLHVATY